MKVINFLDSKKNNLDLMRIILSVSVIFGHSSILNGTVGIWIDPILKLFPYTYSGALAVKLFFFISGFVMMSSLYRDPSILRFAISRFARLIPGLALLLCVTVFVIGPFVSVVSVVEYFRDPRTYAYLFKNLIFWSQSTLPGVFESAHYRDVVNGSLWSLMYEVACYIALITIVSLLKNNRKLITLFSVSIILISLIPNNPLLLLISKDPNVNLLPMSFAIGVLISTTANIIEISMKTTVIGWLIFLLARGTAIEFQCLIFAFAITILLICSQKWALTLKPHYDISYGTYLWGFLVQQCIFYYLGSLYTWLHFIIATTVSMALGFLSFVLVEKRSIELGKVIYKKIQKRLAFNNNIQKEVIFQ